MPALFMYALFTFLRTEFSWQLDSTTVVSAPTSNALSPLMDHVVRRATCSCRCHISYSLRDKAARIRSSQTATPSMDAVHTNSVFDILLNNTTTAAAPLINSVQHTNQAQQFDVCSNYTIVRPLNNTLITILVHSAPQNVRLRNSIRCSWGQPETLRRHNASLRFVIGRVTAARRAKRIRKEARRFKDIIRVRVTESYQNLSRKSVESLRWIQQHKITTKYVLKQDDDAFVHLHRLTSWLSLMQARNVTEFIAGDAYRNRAPKRDSLNRYYTSYKTWRFKRWPPMALGPAYVITASVLENLLRPVQVAATAAASFPFLVPWEDVYVTGILRSMRQIRLIDVPHMTHARCGGGRANQQTIVSYHGLSVIQHQQLHQTGTCSADQVQLILNDTDVVV